MHFAPLTSQMRRELHIAKDVHGVVVTGVDDGSAADEVGLSRGDVLVAINQQPVNTPQEAADEADRRSPNRRRKSALLLLNRHGVTQYVGVSLGGNQG